MLAAGCVSFPAIVGASPRAPELPEPVACERCCRPALEGSWQWPLQGPIDTSFDVEMYDVDGFEVPRGVIAGLHDDGSAVACYISAGS